MTPKTGSFVRFTEERGDQRLAHVRLVHDDGTVDLRVTRIAQPNVDVERVPFSEQPKPLHWSPRR